MARTERSRSRRSSNHRSSRRSSRRPSRSEKRPRRYELPQYNHNGHEVTKGIHPDGESGRRGIHPVEFVRISFRSGNRVSMAVNILWPFVPAAIALYFGTENHLWIFILNYIAMVPTANLVGFAGQELARKLPKVIGILLETTLSSVVEIILLIVLLKDDSGTDMTPIIQAAILGSILANLLFCLGLVFFVGGLRREEQEFHGNVSEVGSGLLLVAGFGLLIPSAYSATLSGTLSTAKLEENVLTISRATAVILLVAMGVFLYFQLRSHHNIFDEILEADELKDTDRHKDLKKDKLTLTEAIVALLIALALVAMHAVFLVKEIDFIVEEHGVSENFMGLILVPLVEKAAEHLTAIDEAWDNQMNFALYHCLGPSIQTALLNAPLVVICGWGLNIDMNLNFSIFMVSLLVLAILVVGNFLRDGKSNYLEGALCVLVYVIIGVSAWYYPSDKELAESLGSSEERLIKL
ncbi:MAG: hypothetical protein M1834_009060 [Cirrosporium novae-zelandiae]|nr:MAG: hypothetical protein M1834_009060 [Cirrosporium novae-zelandiae]